MQRTYRAGWQLFRFDIASGDLAKYGNAILKLKKISEKMHFVWPQSATLVNITFPCPP